MQGLKLSLEIIGINLVSKLTIRFWMCKKKKKKNLKKRVGKKLVNMSIDRAGGHYWLKPVNTGRLKILWSV
jgi:hypothetical protein